MNARLDLLASLNNPRLNLHSNFENMWKGVKTSDQDLFDSKQTKLIYEYVTFYIIYLQLD